MPIDLIRCHGSATITGKAGTPFEHTNASPVMVIHCFMLPHVMALVRSELSVTPPLSSIAVTCCSDTGNW